MSPEAGEQGTLVDSNVLLDLFTEDPTWSSWSAARLAEALDRGPLAARAHRAAGGVRASTLPDLLIGAHAAVLDRDPADQGRRPLPHLLPDGASRRALTSAKIRSSARFRPHLAVSAPRR